MLLKQVQVCTHIQYKKYKKSPSSRFAIYLIEVNKIFIIDVPTVKIKDGFVVDYGESFTLNCSINASPQVDKLYWQKESNGITSKLVAGLAGTNGMSLDNPSLTITFASMRDSGMYTCIASNSIGTGKSNSANITVHGGNYNKCKM